jgi:hydrogenase/urease accessory protein HupE
MLCRNLITASCVMFTTSIASIYFVNVLIAMNKNLNPAGALGKIPTMSIFHIAKGQEISIGQRGFACFVVCFWKNWQSLHLVTISIASCLAVG